MTKRRSCPSCKSQGRDSTDNHLFLMKDGSTWYCNRCYYMERSDNVEMNYNLEELIHSKPLDIPSLKLSKEDLEFWGCKTLLDPSSGQVEALLYPVKEDGKIKGYKGRKLGVDVKEGRFFKAAGTLKGNSDLFGQDLWENGRKLLIITEGEKDAIAVRKMLQKKGKSYCVVSLPNGASVESIKHNFEFVNKFEKILLIFDNDEAGRKATDSVVSLLPPGKVSVAHIPDKDAFEMYEKGKIDEFWKSLQSAQEKRPDGIVLGKDTWDIISSRPSPICIPYPEGWDHLNRMTLGIRLGELDTWTSGSGSGKTAIFRQLRYHIWRATGPDYDKYFGPEAEHLKNSSIGVISLEESLDEAVDGTLSIHLKERLSVKRAVTNTPWWCKFLGIESNPQDESAKRYQAWKEVMGSNRFHFFDHFGSLDEEGLLPKIQYMARALNVKFIFLDHLSIVISEFADEGGERGKIDALMTKLKRLTQELNIWIGLVVHLRKAQGKPFEEGAVPSLDDLRGSAGIKQLSNGVFTIARNQQDPDEYRRNTSSLHVLKCFDPETRVLTPDYSSVPIKSIREGDYLVRPDGTKAKVLRTRFGYDEMFRVKQSRGMDYVVSSKHDIVLTDKVVQAREFTGGKGYVDRRGHNPESPLVFPDHPWLYGLWIGDGDTRDPIISVSESQPEVLESIKQVWNRLKVKSTERGCYRVSLLGEKSLLPRFGRGEKKVVDKDIFKYSLKDRLLVLSGWIDSDGTSHNDGSGFSIIIKDRKLAESCIKLARSCGLRAYLRGNYSWCQGMDKKRWYHRVYITGDVLRLSMVCKNKVPREEVLNGKGGRDRYISKLTVSEEGYGPYYAVQLEGDPLFLLEDFTVVSNCRFTGTTGSAGYLHFDPDTGLMLPVDSLDKVEVQF